MAIQDAGELLQHIKVVQQTRELVGAMRHVEALNETSAHKQTNDNPSKELRLLEGNDQPVKRRKLTHQEAEATLLVLKDVENPLHTQRTSKTAETLELLLGHIRETIYENNHLPLMTLVYSQSFHQAIEARRLCLQALEFNVAPGNCFSVYKMAAACTLPQLQHRCLDTAQKNFNEAVEIDGSAFCNLTFDQLLSILESNSVEVSNEVEIFSAVAKWIDADKQGRASHLCPLLEKAVRLELMGPASLADLDAHRLVLQSPEATGMVAKAYIQCCYGSMISGNIGNVRLRSRKPQSYSSVPAEVSAEEASTGSCTSMDIADMPNTSARSEWTSSVGRMEEAQVAMSCIRDHSAFQKRKAAYFSPCPNMTPQMRWAARSEAQKPDVCRGCSAAKAKRPCLSSKRRLF